jgi:hypothetical protein
MRRAPHSRLGALASGPAGAFVAAAVYAAWILVSSAGYQASADCHCHFSAAREIAGGDLVPDPAHGLPLTLLRELPVDHYWGYHLLLAPFAALPSPLFGMKVATVVLFGGVLAAIAALLYARSVPYASAWALATAVLWLQDWRYLQLRGGQLVVPLMLAMVHVAFFEGRTALRRAMLVGIAFVAMLSYHGGIVLLPLHVAGAAALALFVPTSFPRARLVEPLLTAAGLALGLTLNPYMSASAATWRFAAYHIRAMGSDAAHLYDDQPIAEFHGFPLAVLASHVDWLVLTLAVVVAALVVLTRAARNKDMSVDEVLFAALALASIVMTARAMRVREYSAPLGIALLAVLSRRLRVSAAAWLQAEAGVVIMILSAALASRASFTASALRTHLPTGEFDGAERILATNGDRPILNVAEADYCMLRWQRPDVACVQGLSRYFLLPEKELFHDVWEIHDRADRSLETWAILRRFRDRGVHLVATHRTHAMARFAEANPDALHLVFRSRANGASLWSIDDDAIDRHADAATTAR